MTTVNWMVRAEAAMHEGDPLQPTEQLPSGTVPPEIEKKLQDIQLKLGHLAFRRFVAANPNGFDLTTEEAYRASWT